MTRRLRHPAPIVRGDRRFQTLEPQAVWVLSFEGYRGAKKKY